MVRRSSRRLAQAEPPRETAGALSLDERSLVRRALAPGETLLATVRAWDGEARLAWALCGSRVIVEGACMIKRHVKKNQQNPNGAIVEREGTVHISNVMKAGEYDARAARRGTTAPAQA